MNVLNPAVMSRGIPLGDVLFQYDHVGIRNLLCVRGGDDRSSIIVNGVNQDRRCSCKEREDR